MGKQNKKGITIDTVLKSTNICYEPGNHLTRLRVLKIKDYSSTLSLSFFVYVVAKLPNICRFVHICFAIKWVVERYNACISLYHIFKHKYLPCLRIIRKTQQQQTVYVHVQHHRNHLVN